MSAKEELEDLIKKEIFKDYHALIEDPLKSLVSNVADRLHYAFETSTGFNGVNGSFIFSSREMVALFHNIGYTNGETPVKFGKEYCAMLTPKAREMYDKLISEGFYKTSNIAKVQEYNPGKE
ncbi:MAG: hypothetical protein Q7S27_07515 [Nanoarchaeota archaeon]|nr:hypothetical protein [Nanoarchaeota archaeon]